LVALNIIDLIAIQSDVYVLIKIDAIVICDIMALNDIFLWIVFSN